MTKDKNKQQVNQPAVSVGTGKQRHFPVISIVLGVLSIAIALVVSHISYVHTLRKDKEHHQYYYLNEARTLAAHIAEHTDSTDEELLSSILYIWDNSEQRPADEYLCIVDKDSKLILHTANPGTVGNYVGDNVILECGCSKTCRTKDVVKRHGDYVGGYVSSAGQKQIAAFTHVLQRDWTIGVHRSESAFLKDIRADLYPMVFGLFIVCVILIPASLGLLTFAFNIAQRKRIKAEEARREKERQMDNLLSNVDAIILEGDPFDIYYVGGQVEKILGYPKELWFKHPEGPAGFWSEILHPDDKDKIEICKEAIAKGQNHSFEYRITASDGREVWFYDAITVETKNGKTVKARSLMIDITERKKAEEALQKSEARYRALVEQIPSVTYIASIDEVSSTLYVSPQIETMLGFEPRQWLQESDLWVGQIHPDDLQQVLDELKASRTTNENFVSEYRMIAKDKHIVWIRDEAAVVKDDSGKALFIQGIMSDITKRKNAEESLRESEKRFRSLSEAAFEGVGFSEKGIIVDANEAFTRIFGYSLGELKGKQVIELVAPESRELVLENIHSGYEEIYEHKGLCKDGSLLDLEVHGRSVAYQGRKMRLTAIRDITERKQAEQALRESEEKYRQLVSTTTDAIMLFDSDTFGFIDVNKSCEELYGYSREEFLKLELRDISEEPEKSEDSVREILKEQFKKIPVRYHRKKDGTIFPVEISGSVFNLKGHKVVCGVIRDITERKRAEEKLYKYQNSLKSLASKVSSSEEQERRQIAAYLHDNISQELALGRIEIESLRKSVGSADKKVIDGLSGRIKTVIENVQSLTFDLSSPTLYKFGLEKAVDELLDDLLEKTEINYKLSHGKSPIQLDNNLSVLLFRCIRELLVNIIKHAKAHNVEVAIRRNGDNIQTTVNDDGIGFDFDQNELLMSRTGGFGLFNIQERISFISGNFDIQSQPGKGSRLTLIVPIKTEMDLSKEKSDAG